MVLRIGFGLKIELCLKLWVGVRVWVRGRCLIGEPVSPKNRTFISLCQVRFMTSRLLWCLSTSLLATEVLGSIPGPVKSDTLSPMACHHCDVSSKLCCRDAAPRRWTLPLVTRFGVSLIPRV